MKLGIFYGPEAPHVDLLENGAREIGWDVECQRISADFRDRDFDAVVVGGHLHRHKRLNGRALYYYQARGVPVFVVEMGRMLHPDFPDLTWWFFYLNRSPARPMLCTTDEAKARAETLFPPVKFPRKRGEYVLVLGQDILPDARQRLIVMPQIVEATDRELVWRPRKEHATVNPHCHRNSLHASLEEDLSGAWCAVTFTSNAGGEALRHGVPVICHPTASYSHLGCTDPRLVEKLKRPKKSDVEDYFSSMAMITWSNAEMQDGSALEWFERSGQIGGERKPMVVVEKEVNSSHVTVLTCTGGRQQTFAKTAEYVGRQRRQPNFWLVVDDCEPETVVPDVGVPTLVLRPDGDPWKPGQKTYARNFRAACQYILENVPDAEWIAVFEDDDWYSSEYLDFLIPLLQSKYADGIRMGGEFSNVYYHVGTRRWHRVGIAGKSATMASTVFHAELIPEILESIENYEEMSLDLRIYQRIDPDKWALFDTDNVIGLKGIPSQRGGGSHTHTQKTDWWDDDHDLKVLRGFVGEDADFYAQFYEFENEQTGTSMFTPAQWQKMSPLQKRYAKMREQMRKESGQ